MNTVEGFRETRARAKVSVERIRTLAAPILRADVDRIGAREPALGRVLGYHLGFNDAGGRPEAGDRGGMAGSLCLTVLAAQAAGADLETALAAGVALEWGKDSTQLLDDIIDDDPIRRERASAWAAFGIPLTLLAADAAKTLALKRLADGGPHGPAAMLALLQALDTCTVGQAQDIQAVHRPLAGDGAVSHDEYLRIAGNKTCSILGAAFTLGAILSGASAPVIEHLAMAGRQLGLAWQVLDDLLDLWGPEPSYNDLRLGKRSYPVICALATEHPARSSLVELLAGGPERVEELSRAAALIERLGGRVAAERASRHHFEAAVRILQALPLAGPARQELIGVASMIGLRGANRSITIAFPSAGSPPGTRRSAPPAPLRPPSDIGPSEPEWNETRLH